MPVVKIAMPRSGASLAPCFEYSATITIYSTENGVLLDQVDFPLTSALALDRLRLLRDQSVTVLICGGVANTFEELVRASGIQVISWVTGSVSDVLARFMSGELATARRSDFAAGEPPSTEE